MADSIVERILQEWEAMLQTISVENGQENDIDLVERFTLGTMDEAGDIVVQVKQGSDVPDAEENTPIGIEARVVTIHTVIKMRYMGPDADSRFNSVAQDIYSVTMATPAVRKRGGLARDTRFQASDPVEVDEAGTQGEKTISFDIPYRHALGDMTQ